MPISQPSGRGQDFRSKGSMARSVWDRLRPELGLGRYGGPPWDMPSQQNCFTSAFFCSFVHDAHTDWRRVFELKGALHWSRERSHDTTWPGQPGLLRRRNTCLCSMHITCVENFYIVFVWIRNIELLKFHGFFDAEFFLLFIWMLLSFFAVEKFVKNLKNRKVLVYHSRNLSTFLAGFFHQFWKKTNFKQFSIWFDEFFYFASHFQHFLIKYAS